MRVTHPSTGRVKHVNHERTGGASWRWWRWRMGISVILAGSGLGLVCIRAVKSCAMCYFRHSAVLRNIRSIGGMWMSVCVCTQQSCCCAFSQTPSPVADLTRCGRKYVPAVECVHKRPVNCISMRSRPIPGNVRIPIMVVRRARSIGQCALK